MFNEKQKDKFTLTIAAMTNYYRFYISNLNRDKNNVTLPNSKNYNCKMLFGD